MWVSWRRKEGREGSLFGYPIACFCVFVSLTTVAFSFPGARAEIVFFLSPCFGNWGRTYTVESLSLFLLILCMRGREERWRKGMGSIRHMRFEGERKTSISFACTDVVETNRTGICIRFMTCCLAFGTGLGIVMFSLSHAISASTVGRQTTHTNLPRYPPKCIAKI